MAKYVRTQNETGYPFLTANRWYKVNEQYNTYQIRVDDGSVVSIPDIGSTQWESGLWEIAEGREIKIDNPCPHGCGIGICGILSRHTVGRDGCRGCQYNIKNVGFITTCGHPVKEKLNPKWCDAKHECKINLVDKPWCEGHCLYHHKKEIKTKIVDVDFLFTGRVFLKSGKTLVKLDDEIATPLNSIKEIVVKYEE